MARPRPPVLSNARWAELLEHSCALFALMALPVAFFYNSDFFALWGYMLEREFAGGEFNAADEQLKGFLLGIQGGTLLGKWVAAYFVARHLRKTGARWARDVLAGGLLGWFFLDSAVSIWYHAGFNIVVINIVPLILVGGILLDSIRRHKPSPGSPRPAPGRWTFPAVACVLFAASGFVFVLWMDSPLLAPWYRALEARYYGGSPLNADSLRLLYFLGGSIGASIVAHFAMLAAAAYKLPDQRWPELAFLLSVTAWFTIDSVACLRAGAAFNVYLINIPFLVLAAFVALRWNASRRLPTKPNSSG